MLILSTIVLFVFGALRLRETFGAPPATDAFGIRHVNYPWVALIHIIPGLLYLALVPPNSSRGWFASWRWPLAWRRSGSTLAYLLAYLELTLTKPSAHPSDWDWQPIFWWRRWESMP